MANNLVCSLCGEIATVFVSTIVGGDIREVAYCALHGKQAGVMDPSAYGFIDQGLLPKSMSTEVSCSKCSLTLEDVKKTSRLGCATCYESFEDYLEDILKRMQKNTMHLGKIPKRALELDIIKDRVKTLERKMEQLIKNEQFEDAALIRDAIANYKNIMETIIKEHTND